MEQGPTSLLELEAAGKVRRQLRHALQDAGITDLKQLQDWTRSRVLLLPGISAKSLATIDIVMREAGLVGPIDF